MVEAFRSRQQEIAINTEGELPESKIFDLLSSVGNGEHKAVELIAMKEGVIYSPNALNKEMINRQGENPGWKMGWEVPFAHCRYSLAPIGFVTREALFPDGTAWGYEIKQYGLHTGVPFSGLLLKWSYEHRNHSLYRMFGKVSSPSIIDEYTQEVKSSLKTRYQILRQISKRTDTIRQRDILYATDEDRVAIGRHVRALGENGVVTYDSARRRESAIWLSSEQRESIDSLFAVIDKFKSGDRKIIEAGRRFAHRVANDPILFSELMLKAKEASPNANRTSREDMRSALISILQGHPNSTTNQIQKYLERDYDKRLLGESVRRNLSALIKGEKVVLEKTKSGNIYRVVETENNH